MAIQISGCPVIDNSRNLTNIANSSVCPCANTFVLRGADGKISRSSIPLNLGDSFEGGFLICCSGSVYWIVSPDSAQVARTWYCRNDANTTAQSVSGCTGWFVPTSAQLQNPGFCRRNYWDSFSSSFYWSSTEINATRACFVCFTSGSADNADKDSAFGVRAFRCVTY